MYSHMITYLWCCGLTSFSTHLAGKFVVTGSPQPVKQMPLTLPSFNDALLLRAMLRYGPKLWENALMESLSIHLYCRFQKQEQIKISDMEEALSIGRTLLERRPPGHPSRVAALDILARHLQTRFEQFGMLSDLDEALALRREELQLRPQGDYWHAGALMQVAYCLSARFYRMGILSDVDEAISLEREIVELPQLYYDDRAFAMSDLAASLHARFRHLRQLSDLEEAISLEQEALKCIPTKRGRIPFWNNLAYYLLTRFDQLGAVSDLDDALLYARKVLKLRPPGHPLRASSLYSVARYLFERFKQLQVREHPYLDEAISLGRDALRLCSQVHPRRPLYHCSLATFLYTRFMYSTTHDPKDLEEIFNLFSQLTNFSRVLFTETFSYLKYWINIAEKNGHSTTVLAYQTSLRLNVQHLAALPSCPEHLSILKGLMASTAVDAFSACVRHGCLTDAVELLEQGRGVFWGQLIRLRSPPDDVIASGDRGKVLADKFMGLSSLLRKALGTPANAESRHDRTCSLSVQLQGIIAEIRELPGLSRFLQPLLFSDLRIAATQGPVIIVNCSQYSCDALIILHDRDPTHVALPKVTKPRVSELLSKLHSLRSRAKVSDASKELLGLLRELWDEIVSPIVNILQEFCPRGSRIWWCPTAEFSLLPLHAADPFRRGQQGLSDLYVSSYTPTLAALIRARRERPSAPSIEQHRFLVVGQAQAPGQCELASVGTELSNISQRMGSIATLTCVQGQDATIANVAENLNTNEFVHLACHGVPDRKQPFESGFALGDGLLKVENIMGYDLQNARFAYLSACHTTVGDEESPDEVIHLAAAMQFAGFRSVIGTMWAVDDAHTNAITSKFYAEMMGEDGRLDHTRAALALHKTMRSMRSSNVPVDQQILYVHIGA